MLCANMRESTDILARQSADLSLPKATREAATALWHKYRGIVLARAGNTAGPGRRMIFSA